MPDLQGVLNKVYDESNQALRLSASGIAVTDLLDAAYPVGEVVTLNAPTYASAKSGATMPEVGTMGGSFLGFDAGATETAIFTLGSLVPRTWRTVDLYVEFMNLTGGTGGVVLEVNVNSLGAATTTITLDGTMAPPVERIGGQTYTLLSKTVAGIAKYGATVELSRLGGNGSDDYAADFQLAALHAVRVT